MARRQRNYSIDENVAQAARIVGRVTNTSVSQLVEQLLIACAQHYQVLPDDFEVINAEQGRRPVSGS